MKSLTLQQQTLLALVQEQPGLTTAAYRRLRGDCQPYESHLRDRLQRLADRGLLGIIEQIGPSGGIVRRQWYPA